MNEEPERADEAQAGQTLAAAHGSAIARDMLQTDWLTLHRENQKLRDALENIIKQQPCCEGGGCFYPMHDGEGNYIGEQNVDPLGVIQGMVQTAQDGLSPNAPGERPGATT